MMLESIQCGPLVYPTIEENGQVRDKKYAELTEQEKLQDDCDVQALNIVLARSTPRASDHRQRWTTAVVKSESTAVKHRRDHRSKRRQSPASCPNGGWTTGQPPLDHRRTTGQRWLTASQGGSTVGPGLVQVRGGRHFSTSTVQVAAWRLDQSDGDTWHWRVSVQGTVAVSPRLELKGLIRQEDKKRIAIEKEAAELEAKRKSQECLNIEEKSIPQASIRSRKLRIDPTLSNFTVSTKRIPFSTVKTVNSLRMGDKHLDTQKGSLESSVKDPIPILSESDVISDGDCDDDYQKRFDLKVQQLWMPSIYDENNKIRECYMIRPSAITSNLPIPDSLIMEDEHLDTIPVTDSANTIKSSVEDLVPTPSESADLSDGESKCDVPINDESSLTDDESLSDVDVPNEKISKFIRTSFDEESLSTKIDPNCFNAESYLIEYLLNRDTLIDSSPKFDYLLEEFSGRNSYCWICPFDLFISTGTVRIKKKRNLKIADTIVESLSPPPIPVEDSDSHMEEIDLFLASDDSMPPGIEIDDYDSEGDIRFLEELLSNDSPPLPKMCHFLMDHFDNPLSFPSSSRNHRIPQDHEDPCLFSILQSSGLRSFAYFGILNPDPVKRIENEAKTVAGTRMVTRGATGVCQSEYIDSLMEEIDLFLASDDSMPSGIEIDDYDSEGDIRFLEELFSNDSPPLLENESFSLDHFDDPSLPRPPPEPPDVEICFDFKPDKGVVTNKVVGDISEQSSLLD
ncbi:hypothetical protein Tco_0411958 [Tanacetum coccineum]